LDRLGLCSKETNINLVGIDSTYTTNVLNQTIIKYGSRFEKVQPFSASLMILPAFNKMLPYAKVHLSDVNRFKGLRLADPNFQTPGKIDILLGALEYVNILKNGKIKRQGTLAAVDSKLGFLISGSVNTKTRSVETNHRENKLEANFSIQQFWELENVPNENHRSPEDQFAEQHFIDTHSRLENGRYQVRLPFREDPRVLGESKTKARNQMYSIQRAISRTPDMQLRYNQFLDDYLKLGHMEKITET